MFVNFIEQLLNGLRTGSVYALIALGYTMVYGIAKMINFAHGDIIMVGAYALYVLAAMVPNCSFKYYRGDIDCDGHCYDTPYPLYQ